MGDPQEPSCKAATLTAKEGGVRMGRFSKEQINTKEVTYDKCTHTHKKKNYIYIYIYMWGKVRF